MKRTFLTVATLFATFHTAWAQPHRATATVKLENTANQESAALEDFVELAKQGPALAEIVARLALTTAWKMELAEASARLDSVLEVSVTGKDGKITATDDSPVMAAIIANTAASVLQTREGEAAAKTLAPIERAVEEQSNAVADKRKLITQIIRQSAIVVENHGPAQRDVEPTVKEGLDAAGYSDAKRDFETARNLLEQLEAERQELKAGKRLRVHHVIWARAEEE